MSSADFDVVALAKYLHLSPQQVQKLAERGQIAGRKVGAEWRFSQAEVHHWLEEKIGAADDADLQHMEAALKRATGGAGEPVATLSEMLRPEAIALPLAARTRNSVISDMVELAAATGLLWDTRRMAEAVRERENLHPTALDCGVALLHARRPLATILAEPLLAFGRTDQGLPFGAGRNRLTDLFFLICSVDDRQHLQTLARLSRVLVRDDVLIRLRSAVAPAEVVEIISAAESEFQE